MTLQKSLPSVCKLMASSSTQSCHCRRPLLVGHSLPRRHSSTAAAVKPADEKESKSASPVEMISGRLYDKLFGRGMQAKQRKPPIRSTTDLAYIEQLCRFLPSFSADGGGTKGAYLDGYLRQIATSQSAPYVQLMQTFADAKLPPMPKQGDWSVHPGWTRYTIVDGVVHQESVAHPVEAALVFDVEIVVEETMAPCMATAVSEEAWYSWCSPHLAGTEPADLPSNQRLRGEHLLSMGSTDTPRVLIGHNVGFDRARVADMFDRKLDETRLWDTMSMQIATHGMTNEQLLSFMGYWKAKGTETSVESKLGAEADDGSTVAKSVLADVLATKRRRATEIAPWPTRTCRNSLLASHLFHCPSSTTVMNKDERAIFEKGSSDDVRLHYQSLMSYCATDSLCTHELFAALWPKHVASSPHPATTAGMLHMSRTYLPLTSSWEKFINSSEAQCHKMEMVTYESVKQLARRVKEEAKATFRTDPWLWSIDWTPSARRGETRETADPKWFRTLIGDYELRICNAVDASVEKPKSVRARSTSYLLKLCWNGHPLVHTIASGWGYAVIDEEELAIVRSMHADAETITFLKTDEPSAAPKVVPIVEMAAVIAQNAALHTANADMMKGGVSHDVPIQCVACYADGTQDTVDLPNSFMKIVQLPHPMTDGAHVGNPLQQPFLKYIKHGVLHSHLGEYDAQLQLLSSSMQAMSYWISCQSRVRSQIVCTSAVDDESSRAIVPNLVVTGTITRRAVERLWMTVSNPKTTRIGSELKAMVMAPDGFTFVGADVDSQEQWLAALLADQYACDRQSSSSSPSARLPGTSAFARTLLAGNKTDGTDLHSRIAHLLGIDRNDAKVLNYGRLYGAGEQFARKLLTDCNPTASPEKISKMAATLYAETKGKREKEFQRIKLKAQCHILFDEYLKANRVAKPPGYKHVHELGDEGERESIGGQIYLHKSMSSFRLSPTKVLKDWFVDIRARYPNLAHVTNTDMLERVIERVIPMRSKWSGGNESDVFNALEEIAYSPRPRTPVLRCALSEGVVAAFDSLEPVTRHYSDDSNSLLASVKRSRVNWVVQSSAVDFLHILLTVTAHLIDVWHIEGARFSISIHDEIRYLVKEEEAYVMALALHTANLLARSVISQLCDVHDLPSSIAFFSAVDIDKCLRKEVDLDCVTPSNPTGITDGYGVQNGVSVDFSTCAQMAMPILEERLKSQIANPV